MKPWGRKLFLAAGVELAIIALALVMFAMIEGPSAARARRAVTFLVMAEAMAAAFAPLYAAERAARGPFRRALLSVLEPVGWVLAVSTSGEFLLAVIWDRGALAAWGLSKLAAAGAGLAGAGLVLALARLTRRPFLSVAAAGTLMLAFQAQPLYTLTAIEKAESPRTSALLIDLGVRSPWMAAAYAMNRAGPIGWRYAPVVSPGLYDRWVGTDRPVAVPGPGRYLLEYLMVAAGLAALAALRRGQRQQESPPPGEPEHPVPDE